MVTAIDPAAAEPQQPLGRIHRIWFFSALAIYFVVLVLIPPFQTNDEDAHFIRMWTVATGHVTCKPIPSSVNLFIAASGYWPVRNRAPYKLANVDSELAVRGTAELSPPGGATCLYIPVSYLVPALLARALADPANTTEVGRMMLAFYAARLFNLALCALAIWLGLKNLPWLRTVTLVLFSLPMLMQQGISINQDSTILFLGLSILILWWRPPTFARSTWMLALLSVLWLTKPVYLVLHLLFVAALIRQRRFEGARPRGHYAALASIALVPLTIWLLWSVFILADPAQRQYLPSWVDMPGQVAYLKQHPWMVPKVIALQFRDLFGRGHLTGGWIGVIGVMGWADFELGDRAYYAFVAGAMLACAADHLRRARLPATLDVAERWWDHLAPFAAFFALIPSFAIAMYVQFSAVGSVYALGTSGRYLHLPYFAMLALGLTWLQARWPAPEWPKRPALANGLTVASMALCAVGVWDAIKAIATRYYFIG